MSDKLPNAYVLGPDALAKKPGSNRGQCAATGCGSTYVDGVRLWDGETITSQYHRDGAGYGRRGWHCLNCGSVTQRREYRPRLT